MLVLLLVWWWMQHVLLLLRLRMLLFGVAFLCAGGTGVAVPVVVVVAVAGVAGDDVVSGCRVGARVVAVRVYVVCVRCELRAIALS